MRLTSKPTRNIIEHFSAIIQKKSVKVGKGARYLPTESGPLHTHDLRTSKQKASKRMATASSKAFSTCPRLFALSPKKRDVVVVENDEKKAQ